MVEDKYVLIPSTTACYLTITGYVFFLGAYGSLLDAAIWWCLRTGGGGVLTSPSRSSLYLVLPPRRAQRPDGDHDPWFVGVLHPRPVRIDDPQS